MWLAHEASRPSLGTPGDDATIVRALNGAFDPVDLLRALDWSADALLRAERIGDPVLLFLAADRRFGAACPSPGRSMRRTDAWRSWGQRLTSLASRP